VTSGWPGDPNIAEHSRLRHQDYTLDTDTKHHFIKPRARILNATASLLGMLTPSPNRAGDDHHAWLRIAEVSRALLAFQVTERLRFPPGARTDSTNSEILRAAELLAQRGRRHRMERDIVGWLGFEAVPIASRFRPGDGNSGDQSMLALTDSANRRKTSGSSATSALSRRTSRPES